MTLAETSLSDFAYSSPVHQKMEWGPEGAKQHYEFIHTGYAVGGNRRLDEKEFPPHDGSSFLREFALPKSVENWNAIGFSTADLFATVLAHTQGSEGTWMSSERGKAWAASADGVLPELYHVVENSEVHPGDIRITRTGVSAENLLGTGGMSWIVLERQGDDEICLSANRDMPRMEGVGTEVKPLLPAEGQTIVYLRSNDAHFIGALDYHEVIAEVDLQIVGLYRFSDIFESGVE